MATQQSEEYEKQIREYHGVAKLGGFSGLPGYAAMVADNEALKCQVAELEVEVARLKRLIAETGTSTE